MGLCSKGPLIRMGSKTQKDILFCDIKPDMAALVIDEVVVPVVAGTKVEEPTGALEGHTLDLESPFFTMQDRVVLGNNGHADPEKLDEYLVHGGYQGLRRALSMTSEEICKEMLASGLRGRGGAGFPTGMKWDFARKVKADTST